MEIMDKDAMREHALRSDHHVIVAARVVYDVACPCGYSWTGVEDAEDADVLADSHSKYVRNVKAGGSGND